MTRLAIRMPKMSMTMTEGEVSSWSVKVGDEITDGDIVCEVMTDKVDMDVESPVSGTLVEIVVESGTVAVGEPIDQSAKAAGEQMRDQAPAGGEGAIRRDQMFPPLKHCRLDDGKRRAAQAESD